MQHQCLLPLLLAASLPTLGCAHECSDDGLSQDALSNCVAGAASSSTGSGLGAEEGSTFAESTDPSEGGDTSSDANDSDEGGTCGDGELDPGEACDHGPTGSDQCDVDCTPVVCGDGIVNTLAGEDCDSNGATVDCDYDCTTPECGDGIINGAAGEQCEPGVGSVPCSGSCAVLSPLCGDGVVNRDAGEECDEGGQSTDTCDADCTLPECGDGFTNPFAGESCDGAGDNLACDADCTPATCGDGYTNLVAEACDHGGDGQTAACEANCTVPTCGDGIINVLAGETCEDGNAMSGDGCESDCSWSCRNGAEGLTQGGLYDPVSPDRNMMLCRDNSAATCYFDLGDLCPTDWHLCTGAEFEAHNDGWDYVLNAQVAKGASYYYSFNGNLSSLRALVFSDPNIPLGDQTSPGFCNNFRTSEADVCDGPETLPACGFEPQFAAMCCAPSPLCGNGVVDPGEQCDDAGDDSVTCDDCRDDCTYRVPSLHGLPLCGP